MNDLIYFDFNETKQVNKVGIVISVPRKGWRHRFGKIKIVVGN